MAGSVLAELADIVPETAKVDIGGGRELEVSGLSIKDLVTLFRAFPEFEGMAKLGKIDVPLLLRSSDGAVAAIIAAAAGEANSKKAIAGALKLPIGVQAEILAATWRLTFPNGARPLLEMVEAAGGVSNGAQAAQVSDGASPEPPAS